MQSPRLAFISRYADAWYQTGTDLVVGQVHNQDRHKNAGDNERDHLLHRCAITLGTAEVALRNWYCVASAEQKLHQPYPAAKTSTPLLSLQQNIRSFVTNKPQNKLFCDVIQH